MYYALNSLNAALVRRQALACLAALTVTGAGCAGNKSLGPPDPAYETDNAAGCPVYDTGSEDGLLSDSSMRETSGVAISRTFPGIYWVHNDSGDTARIFAIGKTGLLQRDLSVRGASNIDWEDIAIGRDAEGNSSLFISDTGDNNRVRTGAVVYRVREPDPTMEISATEPAVRFDVSYTDRQHDAEALLFDDVSKHGFIVTKEKDGASVVFDIGDLSGPAAQHTATYVTELSFGIAPLAGSPLVTGGDMNASQVVIRTYTRAFSWPRTQGETLAATLQKPPCKIPIPSQAQGESIGLDDWGNYVTISEGKASPVWRFTKIQ